MPWVAQLVISLIPLLVKLIDAVVPSMIHNGRKFKTKKRVIDGLNRFRGKTIEEIAKIGRQGDVNGLQG